MLLKLIFMAAIAVDVLGRTTFDVSDDPYYEEYSRKVATEYCKATHAEDKAPEIKLALKKFAICLAGQIDSATITTDLKEAEASGSYEGIIKKYCAKAPQLKECARGLAEGMAPCLPAGMARTAVNSTNTLIDFVCDNDGARISSFVKEDGPRCIKDKMFDITFCQQSLKSNLSKVTNMSGDGIASSLLLSEQDRCILTDQGLTCVVNAMKGCPNPIPAKLGQEFHDIYLESMSCSKSIQYDKTTEVIEGTTASVDGNVPGISPVRNGIEELKKLKLELEIRTAELDIWNRENELNVRHTVLTSDVKSKTDY